ncbi:SWI/SNF complex subunit SWI3B-like [Salvia divinorum]|uniref:SWI/SNF complex subunit SWI3B-like n=1 Tax=Salvia divinorum TaxID=28513 RepID=A0ABD1FUL1_SALDI
MAAETTPPPKPSPVTPAASAADRPPPSSITLRLSEPDADVIHIPTYSRWFSWNAVHECEARFLPEFFDGRSPSKNPNIYKYYRNAIIRRFRENPTRKITLTEMRKTIVGDVGSIRRVFDFLEAWGLINYAGSTSRPQLKWEDKDTKSSAAQGGGDVAVAKKRVCSGCKTPCTIACFESDKHDMTLCARCYVRGNYRVGLSSADFKRVEISEEAKSNWSDKDTLQLLEALMHYGDDWKKVAEHVGGRTAKECVAHFIKLPFGEQFDGPPESRELDTELALQNAAMTTKRMHLSPLADASNPIMAQAAFLSTLVGVDVAEVAAHAAVTAISDVGNLKQQESGYASNGNTLNKMEESLGEAKLQLEKEEEELEKTICGTATQTMEIEDKILHFEEFDLQMERKLQQFQQLQNLLFVDKLTILFHKNAAAKSGDNAAEPVKID